MKSTLFLPESGHSTASAVMAHVGGSKPETLFVKLQVRGIQPTVLNSPRSTSEDLGHRVSDSDSHYGKMWERWVEGAFRA